MDNGNPNFDKYKEVFKNLTHCENVETPYDVVSIIISYDSTRAICILKESDVKSCIMQYDLDMIEKPTFTEDFIGTYIKMQEVE